MSTDGRISGELGELRMRVASLERDMAVIRYYGARLLLLVFLLLAGAALNIKASSMQDFILERLTLR